MQLKPIHFLVVIFLILSYGVRAEGESSSFGGEKHIFAILASSENVDEAKLGAKVIYQEAVRDIGILDLVAGNLSIQINKSGELDELSDLIAWQGKALAKSGFTRYTNVLQKMAENTESKKIAKYGKKSLSSLNDSSHPPFSYSAKQFLKKQKQFSQIAQNNLFSEKKYNEITVGTKLDEVLDLVGMPNDIYGKVSEPIVIRGVVPGGIKIRKTALVLSYTKQGEIYFMSGDSGWHAVLISNVHALSRQANTDEEKQLIETLLSNDWLNMRKPIALASRHNQSRLVYDIATERLLQSKNTSAAYEADMLAHVAKLIASSNSSRYLPALREVHQTARSKSIRRHSKRAVKQLEKLNPNTSVEEYQLGEINIGDFSAR